MYNIIINIAHGGSRCGKTKIEWISIFRKAGDSILAEFSKTKKSKNDKASEINKHMKMQIDYIVR